MIKVLNFQFGAATIDCVCGNRIEAKRREAKKRCQRAALSSLIAICVICSWDSAGFNIQFVQTFVESVESPCATACLPPFPSSVMYLYIGKLRLNKASSVPNPDSLSLSCSLWGSMQGQVQPISECGSNRRCVATSAARSTQLPQRRNTSFILITIRLPKEEEQQQPKPNYSQLYPYITYSYI